MLFIYTNLYLTSTTSPYHFDVAPSWTIRKSSRVCWNCTKEIPRRKPCCACGHTFVHPSGPLCDWRPNEGDFRLALWGRRARARPLLSTICRGRQMTSGLLCRTPREHLLVKKQNSNNCRKIYISLTKQITYKKER